MQETFTPFQAPHRLMENPRITVFSVENHLVTQQEQSVTARITEKNYKRFRIQFSMCRELYERYETFLTRAASLHLVIDFTQDFEDWFGQQLQQVQQELDRIETQNPVTQ